MADWYLYSLIALVLFGFQRFLYKVSAEERCDSALVTFSFMATVTLFGGLLFLVLGGPVKNPSGLVMVALINSFSFFTGTIATMEALRRLSATMVMPLVRLSTALVVLFGILYFRDTPSSFQYLGIILSMSVIVLLARSSRQDQGGHENRQGQYSGFLFALAALLAGAVAAVSSAFAALYVDKLAFIALSYLMGTVFSLILYRLRGSARGDAPPAKSLAIGTGIGVINFAGFYSLLMALERGPISLIIPVTGLYFVIAVVLSVIVYREKVDLARFTALIMTVAAIIVMRL